MPVRLRPRAPINQSRTPEDNQAIIAAFQIVTNYLRQDAQINLDENINLGVQDEHGNPPLHYAVTNYDNDEDGYSKAVRLLLKHNIGMLEKKDQEGKTPLHFAASQGNLSLIELLFEKNRYPNWPAYPHLTCQRQGVPAALILCCFISGQDAALLSSKTAGIYH